MKYNKVKALAASAAMICLIGFTSCDFLDVVPPEQAGMDDMMIDDATVKANLYSCYGYMQNGGYDVRDHRNPDGGCDEAVQPQEWGEKSARIQWGAYTASNVGDSFAWHTWYTAIGYCNQFLMLMDKYNPDINPTDRAVYIAEVRFMKAYYHFRVLQMYGPCPIVDTYQASNIATSEIPGRSHFDYVVDYIVNTLDEVAEVLPATQVNPQNFGRATSVIAKALKARVLLLAASPLWNGSFPDRSWKNKNYETPGYGLELVSHEYSREKWVRAQEAFKDAINAAKANGHKLYTLEDAETTRERDKVALPDVPGDVTEDFRKLVNLMQYVTTTTPADGNNEIIWGVKRPNGNNEMCWASIPHFVCKNKNNITENIGGWGGFGPTLFTVEHFFTTNGVQPADDPTFTQQSDWFKSAGLSNKNVINLHVGREPRFYAAIGFDGGQYSTVMAAGDPLYLEMRVPERTGYAADIWGTRNYSVSGYLNKKMIRPNVIFNGTGWSNNLESAYNLAQVIRLPELYLGMAECEAQLGNDQVALDWINLIRDRAGVPQHTLATVAALGKSTLDVVLDERFVELYMENQRYYDIRRYVNGHKYLDADCYRGLDAMKRAPSFEEFNTPIKLSSKQPFMWDDRMYLLPVPNKEVYANPQMVQAPRY